jgi:hypothetical protein
MSPLFATIGQHQIGIAYHIIKSHIIITYLLTHGAEAFLRSCHLCSHSGTSQRFMEPDGSLPPSQEPSTGHIIIIVIINKIQLKHELITYYKNIATISYSHLNSN